MKDKKVKSFGEFNESVFSDKGHAGMNGERYEDKIRLEKLDPMGNVVETIELEGRWKITTGEKSYFMTNRYVDEIKVDLEKIQKNFMDNLSESKIYTMEEKELEDILFDISKCNGEKGMEKLVKLQGLWSGMNKSNKIRSKVLKAIKKRLDEIGF